MKHLLIILFLALSVPVVAQNPIVGRSMRLTGEFTASSLSLDQDDYALNPGYYYYNISATTPVTITGIVAMSPGQEILLTNTSSHAITLTHEDTASEAANRFSILGLGQVILGQGAIVVLRYVIATSRWVIVSATVSVIESVGEPSDQVSDMVITNLTTTTLTASWTNGDGTGRILAIAPTHQSGSIVSNLDEIVDNVEYLGDPNYGDGYELNQGACCIDRYVLAWGDVSSVDVTGLTANSNYQILALEFNQQGGAINYNKNTVFQTNRADLTTLASASTPTVAYTITRVIPKQNEIEVQGTRGNGDLIVVPMRLGEGVTATGYPVDDTEYTAGPFGTGETTETGTHITHSGTAANFEMTGFLRDTDYSYPKVIEASSTFKYLLPQ